MKIFEFPLLADENIHPKVSATIAGEGCDICSVLQTDLRGQDDTDILRAAHREQRLVLTHDSDFGQLAVQGGECFTGIIYLRPGNLPPEEVIGMWKALISMDLDVVAPFIAVVEKKGDSVRVRLRPRIVQEPTARK